MPLKPHQELIFPQLLQAAGKHQCTCDFSDPGCGKTYVACELARQRGLKLFVACPKSVIPAWESVAKVMGADLLAAVNPEKLKRGNTPWVKRSAKNKFEWLLPKDTQLVFDEGHMYGGEKTDSAYLMSYAKCTGLPVHIASATVAETPLRLRAPGYLLDLHNFHDFYPWCLRNGCYKNPWRGFEFSKGERGKEALARIHKHIFPEYGVRMRVADIPDYPELRVQLQAFDVDDAGLIQEAYDAAEEEINAKPMNALTALLRARQVAENAKIPLAVELALQELELGHSVIVFVNFKPTLAALREFFKHAGYEAAEISGDQQALGERERNIQDFQENRKAVMLATVDAGGVSVNLHDLKGRPRIAYVFPPLSAVKFKQTLGRTHRTGAMSAAVYHVLFAAGTVEEQVCQLIQRKLNNLDMLNDGDMSGGLLLV